MRYNEWVALWNGHAIPATEHRDQLHCDTFSEQGGWCYLISANEASRLCDLFNHSLHSLPVLWKADECGNHVNESSSSISPPHTIRKVRRFGSATSDSMAWKSTMLIGGKGAVIRALHVER